MLLADVNFLVALHFAGHTHHRAAESCFREIVASSETLGICDFALTGFIRITTSRNILKTPSTLEKALEFAEELLRYPGTVRIFPGEGQWRIFSEICRKTKAAGPLVSDVYLAALALEQGATLVSFDKDFSRFPGLRWRNPLES